MDDIGGEVLDAAAQQCGARSGDPNIGVPGQGGRGSDPVHSHPAPAGGAQEAISSPVGAGAMISRSSPAAAKRSTICRTELVTPFTWGEEGLGHDKDPHARIVSSADG